MSGYFIDLIEVIKNSPRSVFRWKSDWWKDVHRCSSGIVVFFVEEKQLLVEVVHGWTFIGCNEISSSLWVFIASVDGTCFWNGCPTLVGWHWKVIFLWDDVWDVKDRRQWWEGRVTSVDHISRTKTCEKGSVGRVTDIITVVVRCSCHNVDDSN